MMDTKRMRKVLATLGMGWKKGEAMGGLLEAWIDEQGRAPMLLAQWGPDIRGDHMLLVMNVLRERGWHIEFHVNPRDCIVWKGSGDLQEMQRVVLDDTCQSFALVAARALEATDE